jgi:hypothetical protein
LGAEISTRTSTGPTEPPAVTVRPPPPIHMHAQRAHPRPHTLSSYGPVWACPAPPWRPKAHANRLFPASLAARALLHHSLQPFELIAATPARPAPPPRLPSPQHLKPLFMASKAPLPPPQASIARAVPQVDEPTRAHFARLGKDFLSCRSVVGRWQARARAVALSHVSMCLR